jgi:hypothetical protein
MGHLQILSEGELIEAAFISLFCEAAGAAGDIYNGLTDLGKCPTGEHERHPQCGYIGCMDLRIWAKAHRYRWRFEEFYKAEESMHIRGDGRWFVEILCRNGLIYPYGGTTLVAYAKGGVVNRVAELGPDLQPYQTDGKDRVFKFPIERLDEVTAILRPRKRRSVVLTPDQVEARRESLRLAREARKSLSPGEANRSISHVQPRLRGEG